ncbi:MAG: hypothetical protein GYA46_08220 [candidate division Zixibacteria bacterium]|nr:hypothetical protein [candidate division Zixibacteria bacterium]
MNRISFPGVALAGLSLFLIALVAAPAGPAQAESIGVVKSKLWQPTVSRLDKAAWTHQSIDRRSRGYNRAESWYGPSGWRAIVSLEYASPFEKDYSLATSGSGAELSLVTPSPQGLGLRFSLGWSGVDVDDDHGNAAPWPPEIQVDYWKKSMDAYRTFLSLQYRTLPPQNVAGAPEFTIYGGMGFVIHEMDAEMTLYDSNTDRTSHYSAGKTTTTPALTLGCAGSVMFTPRVGVEASLSTDILLHDDDTMLDGDLYGFDSMSDYDGSWAWRLGLIFAF